MNLTQHPLSAAFPAMSGEEFQQLKDDIEVNGQREPVVLLEDMVLDGWHRYRACVELGLTPRETVLDAREDPVAYVLSQNLKRRHLTPSQRANAAVACATWAPVGRPKNTEPGAGFSKNKELADVAGVSERTIYQAKTAIKAGLGDEVKEGKLTVKQAAARASGKSTPRRTAAANVPVPATYPAQTAGCEPEAAELAATQCEIAEELAALRKICQAEDKLAAAVAEIEQLRAENSVLRARNNDLLSKCAELERHLKALQHARQSQEKEAPTA